MLLKDLTYRLAHVQHASVFAQRSDLLWNPQALFSCLCAMKVDIVPFFSAKEKWKCLIGPPYPQKESWGDAAALSSSYIAEGLVYTR